MTEKRATKRPLTDSDRTEIVRLYVEDCLSAKNIAPLFGWSHHKIREVLIANNIPFRSTNDTRKGKTSFRRQHTEDAAILRRYHALGGKRITAVAREFDITPTVLHRVLRDNGVTLRSRKQALEDRTGPQNPNFKHGLCVSGGIVRRSAAKSKAWRKQVLARDKYQCVACRSSDRLEAHHIENYGSYENKRWDPDNGITFCRVCHIAFHRRFGKNNTTKDQTDLFLQREAA